MHGDDTLIRSGVPASRPQVRFPGPLIHVIVLSVLTTATNAAAIAPRTFGGAGTVMVLAIITLAVASLEHVVRNRMRLRIPIGEETKRDSDVLTLHKWGCALAAAVAVICALFAAFDT